MEVYPSPSTVFTCVTCGAPCRGGGRDDAWRRGRGACECGAGVGGEERLGMGGTREFARESMKESLALWVIFAASDPTPACPSGLLSAFFHLAVVYPQHSKRQAHPMLVPLGGHPALNSYQSRALPLEVELVPQLQLLHVVGAHQRVKLDPPGLAARRRRRADAARRRRRRLEPGCPEPPRTPAACDARGCARQPATLVSHPSHSTAGPTCLPTVYPPTPADVSPVAHAHVLGGGERGGGGEPPREQLASVPRQRAEHVLCAIAASGLRLVPFPPPEVRRLVKVATVLPLLLRARRVSSFEA